MVVSVMRLIKCEAGAKGYLGLWAPWPAVLCYKDIGIFMACRSV